MREISKRISVVMPLYNKESTVSAAVGSVLNQTFRNFELLVVDDGSTDKGPLIVCEKKDPRIRLLEQENRGVSAARNRGIREAATELIAFLDADDQWDPDFLETIVRLRTKYPSCDIYATNYRIGEGSKARDAIIRGLPDGFDEGVLTDYFHIAVISDPPLFSSAIAVTKKAITFVGGFPEGITSGEDLLAWTRLALRYSIAYCHTAKSWFRIPEQSAEAPRRYPDLPDQVGDQFAALVREYGKRPDSGLGEYAALWHRMRAVVFLRYGEKGLAAAEIRRARDYSGFTLRLCVLRGLLFLPQPLSNRVFAVLRIFVRFFRRSGP